MKRYKPYIETGKYTFMESKAVLREDPNGDAVLFDDLPQWSSDLEACPLDTWVLVHVEPKHGYIHIVQKLRRDTKSGYEYVSWAGNSFEPTHWMPLPEGPK